MKIVNLAVLSAVFLGVTAMASDDHNLRETCKAECPKATTEDEAHKCMADVVKKKKADKKFRKSDCFEAFKEHEKHDKESGHKH